MESFMHLKARQYILFQFSPQHKYIVFFLIIIETTNVHGYNEDNYTKTIYISVIEPLVVEGLPLLDLASELPIIRGD
jgi:hypothetical protein